MRVALAGLLVAGALGAYAGREPLRDIWRTAMWAEQYRAEAPAPAVVFFGDSLVARWPLGLSFGVLPAANHGIGGDRAELAGDRFGAALALHPRVVVLLIGINDVGQQRPTDAIAADVDGMVARAISSGAAVILCGPPPVRGRWMQDRPPAALRALGAAYRALATKHGAAYVDLAELLAGPDGLVLGAYTRDGLHLNAAGYYRLAAAVYPLLMRRAYAAN